MIGKEDEGMELDWRESLGSRQDSDDDGSQLLGRFEEKPTLHSAAGNFNEGPAFRDES
jgi:hypothetical protein